MQWATKRLHRCKDQAKRSGVTFDLAASDLTSAYLETDGRCPVPGCGKKMLTVSGPQVDVASVDRILPERGYTRGNIQIICGACNQAKGAATVEAMAYHLAKMVNVLRADTKCVAQSNPPS
jgi:hypothetical protein